MSARESLEKLLENMPEERLREIADFAPFLNWQEDRAGRKQFGQGQLAGAASKPAQPIALCQNAG